VSPHVFGMSRRLSYAVVTPARDESDNLRRLARCLVGQETRPVTWIVVDDGSSDGTPDLVEELAHAHPWIRLARATGGTLARGAPIVRGFHTGLAALDPLPEVVVKLDADVSVEPDYFSRLLKEFDHDPQLGIAGGVCYEQEADGVWRQRHGTGPPVWGASRAYRRECLREILPLDEHMGWDTVDQMKANLRGWRTKIFYDLPFRHHRVEGERDGHRLRTAAIQGEGAYYLGYRVSYLIVRTLFRSVRDPAAVGLLLGYARARLRRGPQCPDPELRAYARRQQRLRELPRRAGEALRPRAALPDRPQ
jgi:biofilm PGA synthesis N-glycosyltransferase PgaC